jgi:ATP-binding cassette subfamily C protein
MVGSLLFEALRPLGTEQDITGKTPFFLDDPETVWCVLAGQIDVYVTAREGALQTGGRDHLFTMEAGEALFGVEPGLFGATMGLLAGGIPGTRVLRIPRSLLLEQTDGERTAITAFLADRFLEGLGRGIVKDIVPLPRLKQSIPAGRTELVPNRPAGSETLLWTEMEEGRALFVGTEDLAPGSGLFALPPNCWIVPLEQCVVRSLPTGELLSRGEFAAAFDAFCEMIFSSLAMNARLRAADDLGALRQMQMSSRRALSSAFGTLARALSGKHRDEFVSREESPIRRAFATVAVFLGRSAVFPRGDEIAAAQGEGRESLRDLAQASNLKHRTVTLAGQWWTSDGAPLIAFMNAPADGSSPGGDGTGTPVALLPSGRGYRLVGDEEERLIDEEIAASIAPDAFQVYRPLPGSPLGGRDLLRFGLAGAKKDMGAVLLISVFLALLGLISPEVNRQIFGEVIPQAERGRMLQLFAILVSVALSSGLLHLANGTAFLRTESLMDHDVSAGIWDRILRLPVGFFRKTTSGDLANRALGLFMLRETASRTVKTLLVQSVFLVFFLGQSFWYDWRLALAGLGCLTVPAVLMVAVNLFQLRFQRKMLGLQNRLLALTFQIMTGISKIRVAGAEERSFARWAELFGAQRTLGTKARRLEVFLNTVMALFPLSVAIVILFALVRWSAADASYETGRFMAFWSAFGALQGAFFQMVSSFTATLNMLPLVENLAPILQAEPETGDLKTDPGEITGRIDLEGVVFRYLKDGPPVLKGLDLHIEAGEFVAVVGPSGAGKSTLIRLLLGFDQPESGGIFYDNKDIAELDLGKLRRQIGVVLQSGGLLSGDIASNVRCSRNLSVEQIEDALRTAGMEEDIAAMPMGIHTVITDGANTVSGGQKQRLLIARAVAGKPRVLIFDEATSALDNRTQAMISRSLENIQATRIVVAHRLSTVIGADRICVLEDGRLVEEGKYGELMAKNGLFAELVRRQTV